MWNSCRTKLYICLNNIKILYYLYVNEYNILECDIVTKCTNVPTIWYNNKVGKKHRHYVDIFISSQNKCIEVKSTWTAEKRKTIYF
jgi:hypothetical protein